MTRVIICDGYADATQMKLWCPICGSDTTHDISFIGRRCRECNLDLEDYANPIIPHYKKMHGLSWRSFGLLLGWKPSTMTTYYWKEPQRIIDAMYERGLISRRPNE